MTRLILHWAGGTVQAIVPTAEESVLVGKGATVEIVGDGTLLQAATIAMAIVDPED